MPPLLVSCCAYEIVTPYSLPDPKNSTKSPACSLPHTTMISVIPDVFSVASGYNTIGLSYTGNKCLFVIRVSGRKRVPSPPATMTPFMILFYSILFLAFLWQSSPNHIFRSQASFHSRQCARAMLHLKKAVVLFQRYSWDCVQRKKDR